MSTPAARFRVLDAGQFAKPQVSAPESVAISDVAPQDGPRSGGAIGPSGENLDAIGVDSLRFGDPDRVDAEQATVTTSPEILPKLEVGPPAAALEATTVHGVVPGEIELGCLEHRSIVRAMPCVQQDE